jgi:hypothetical protein
MKPWVVYSLAVATLCVVCPALIGFLVGAMLIFIATATLQRVFGA